jgi:hypothetical protein
MKEFRSERGKIDERSETKRKPKPDRMNKEKERIIIIAKEGFNK